MALLTRFISVPYTRVQAYQSDWKVILHPSKMIKFHHMAITHTPSPLGAVLNEIVEGGFELCPLPPHLAPRKGWLFELLDYGAPRIPSTQCHLPEAVPGLLDRLRTIYGQVTSGSVVSADSETIEAGELTLGLLEHAASFGEAIVSLADPAQQHERAPRLK